ncbi:MAG TPA: hypothetical protein ENI85_11090 [Deltaproteobacteria bacterium]|nr:hypothetical protein [Deltaproteobacteria bacterium]
MKTSTVELEVDRSRCVLCGGPNECALARSSGGSAGASKAPCWCVSERFPAALLDRAAARDGGASCICRRCLERGRTEAAPD